MACHHVKLPGSPGVIVCTRGRRRRCQCGATASLQCDWKVGEGKTCDAHICPGCAREVGPDKHLCPTHQVSYIRWKARRAKRPAPETTG